MEKYLIINADDFGYNEQQNAAIEELLKNQLITSTSVLTVVPSAKQAVDFSGVNHIDVGVHLTINSDYEDKKMAKPFKLRFLSERIAASSERANFQNRKKRCQSRA